MTDFYVPWSKQPIVVTAIGDKYRVDGPGLYDEVDSLEIATDWINREIKEYNEWTEKYICSCGADWPCWDSVLPTWDTDSHHKIPRA